MAFVVVGYAVYSPLIDGKGRSKRDIQISQRFTARAAAEAFCELARKGPYPKAVVRDVMKHDDIN